MCLDLYMYKGIQYDFVGRWGGGNSFDFLFFRLQNEEGYDEVEESEDDFEEMNLFFFSVRSFSRKVSQTSIFFQEWDIFFEQLEIGEFIGKGRFGQVYYGRWYGEVVIRLIDIERDNEEQLKVFKREVMVYRQTRYENVVFFMGVCMSSFYLVIIIRLVLFGFRIGVFIFEVLFFAGLRNGGFGQFNILVDRIFVVLLFIVYLGFKI